MADVMGGEDPDGDCDLIREAVLKRCTLGRWPW